MKPAASLSAKLLVRKGQATPSNLTRRFVLDDPPLLPDTMSAAPDGFSTSPVSNAPEGDFYGLEHESQIPERESQERPQVENRQPDPIQPEQPKQTPVSTAPAAALAIVGEEPPRRAVDEAAAPMQRQIERVSRPSRRPVGSGPRIAMTVRLEHDQHRELHEFADSRGRTCQDVFLRAVEAYMAIHRYGFRNPVIRVK